MLHSADVVLRIVIILLAGAAVLTQLRGETWDKHAERLTKVGRYVLLVGLLTVAASVASYFIGESVHDAAVSNEKEVARQQRQADDAEKKRELDEQENRYSRLYNTALQQLQKQTETLNSVEVARKRSMPVSSITLQWELMPADIEGLRRIIRTALPKIKEDQYLRVNYLRLFDGASPALEVYDERVTSKDFSYPFPTSEPVYVFVNFLGDLATAAHAFYMESLVSSTPFGNVGEMVGLNIRQGRWTAFQGRSNRTDVPYITMTFWPRHVSANDFSQGPVFFIAPSSSRKEDLPKGVNVAVVGEGFSANEVCQTDWKLGLIGRLQSVCALRLRFGNSQLRSGSVPGAQP